VPELFGSISIGSSRARATGRAALMTRGAPTAQLERPSQRPMHTACPA
jgi:hypothetical protein